MALIFELRGSVWAALDLIETVEDDGIALSQEASAYLRAHTAPDDIIITDGQAIALQAQRRVPIEAINTSRMRILTSELTDQQLIDTAIAYRPAAILFWEKKLDSADDFKSWVTCHFDLTVPYDDRHRIYEPRPALALPANLTRLDQPIGGEITLLGYTWQPGPLAVGDTLDLTLYWEARDRPASDYMVYVHLFDRDGQRVAQQDARPRQELCPTWVWQPGERIEDQRSIPITNVGAGAPFTVELGLYDVYTGARLAPDRVILPLAAD